MMEPQQVVLSVYLSRGTGCAAGCESNACQLQLAQQGTGCNDKCREVSG